MRRAVAVLFALLATAAAAAAAADERPLPAPALRSGITFAGPDVRQMQADDVVNPGMLWVARGANLWRAGDAAAPSCGSCHGEAQASMRGVAARYPAYDAGSGTVMDIEARINDCRVRRQKARAFDRESEDLLALAAYVSYQSRGMPLDVAVDGGARPAFERGRAFYSRRHGQMDLACKHCHDDHWGKRLFAETLSQGHGNAFPAYRLEWQGVGSLQRRIRACLFGVRAEMPAAGAPEITDLELFLAWRGSGLPVEAPGVRR